MKIQNILLSALVFLSLPSLAKEVEWSTGGNVTYTMQKKVSPVVVRAAEMFADDMKAVTGKAAKAAASGNILVYQLDLASNKEMKAMASMLVPATDFITKKDAFWVGVRKEKVVVVGSNGRGAAYGLLHLSHLAGVSAWSWWGDVTPTHKDRLVIDDAYETIQKPSIEYRGISLEQFAGIDNTRLMDLLLRLHANFICTNWDGGKDESHALHALTSAAGNYDIAIGSRHGDSQLRLMGHKNHTIDIVWRDDNYGYVEPTGMNADNGGVVYHLSYAGEPHDYLWLSTTQPGLVVNELKTAYRHGGKGLWMAVVHNPKTAAYQLSLFMDMAWDYLGVKNGGANNHLNNWLTEQFGQSVAKALEEPVAQYFRLVGIRRPEFMDFSRQSASTENNDNGDGGVKNTQFDAEEFGNELERYINDYKKVCDKVLEAAVLVDESRRDAYFAAVEYPVYSAALMATKILQAQEARLIGRPASFHHDEEALESAARSMAAFNKQRELNARYLALANGKWQGFMDFAPNNLAVFGKPLLPDTISDEEVKKYYVAKESGWSDNSEDLKKALSQIIVRNASQYSEASASAKVIDLLGRSLRAVELNAGDTLTYSFSSRTLGGVLRLAFVPTHSPDGGSQMCEVSIDGKSPRTIIVTDGLRSERWAEDVLRGQAVVTLPVSLSSGTHRLTIKALSDHVVFDEWMIDRDAERQCYVFPVSPPF